MADERPPGALLTRAWTHAHEEDHDGLLVYRPSEWDFPPARGRDSFELAPDGVLRRSAPGPDDRTRHTSGTWSIEGERLDLYPADSPAHHYQVVEVGPELLLVRAAGEPAQENGGTDASA